MSRRGVDSLPSAGLKLLLTGVLVSIPVSVIATGIIWASAGSFVGKSCALGAVTGLVIMAFSQSMLTSSSGTSPQMTMMIALTAYGTAMVGVIVLLSRIKSGDSFDMLWVAIGVIISGATYIIGALIAHSRLRILYFDTPDEDTLEASGDESSLTEE
ncbi:MAG: hypothetical protein LBG99_00385 [Propionibacteriaceae bacterium]|jgi:hypothetical protein|nr:hypothetical protein [Propionibacteriaceae bacterium]